MESNSEHPIARAIVEAARKKGLDVPDSSDFESETGQGVRASVDERTLRVGGPRMLDALGLEVPEALARAGREQRKRARRSSMSSTPIGSSA